MAEKSRITAHTTIKSTASDMAVPNKPFRLLDLPDELWSKICEMAIDDLPVVQEATLDKHNERKHCCEPPRQPALTPICRTIRQETIARYYSTRLAIHLNASYYGSSSEEHAIYIKKVGRWLKLIGHVNRCQISGVSAIWYLQEDVQESEYPEELDNFTRVRQMLHGHWSVPFNFGDVQLVHREAYSFWKCGIEFT